MAIFSKVFPWASWMLLRQKALQISRLINIWLLLIVHQVLHEICCFQSREIRFQRKHLLILAKELTILPVDCLNKLLRRLFSFACLISIILLLNQVRTFIKLVNFEHVLTIVCSNAILLSRSGLIIFHLLLLVQPIRFLLAAQLSKRLKLVWSLLSSSLNYNITIHINISSLWNERRVPARIMVYVCFSITIAGNAFKVGNCLLVLLHICDCVGQAALLWCLWVGWNIVYDLWRSLVVIASVGVQ